MAEFSGWRQQASNKNLLINPRFRVNQRGQMEYTGAGYGVDGWWLQHVTTANVKDNHVHVSGLWQMEQKLEDVGAGTYTFSIYAENVTGLAELRVADKSGNLIAEKKMQNGITALSFITNEGVNSVYWFGLGSDDSSSDLYAAKLEQGPISTLALDLMQPYTPQDYQREMRECQRHLQVYNGKIGTAINSSNTTEWLSVIQMPVPMRVQPSILVNTSISVRNKNDYRKVTAYRHNTWNGFVLNLWLTLSSALDADAAIIQTNDDGDIKGNLILSAEL